MKFGFDFTRVHDKMINLYQGYGQYSYSTLNDIALDCPTMAMPLPLKGCVPSTGFGGVDGKHYSNYYQAFDALGLDGKTEFNTIDYGVLHRGHIQALVQRHRECGPALRPPDHAIAHRQPRASRHHRASTPIQTTSARASASPGILSRRRRP